MPFLPIETRRNFLVDNMSAAELLGLVDRGFTVGGVQMRGFEDSVPCAIPGNMVTKAGFKEAFANCACLRAEILSGGMIEIGDEVGISPLPAAWIVPPGSTGRRPPQKSS
ncbi:hypothetical protein IPV69_15205 [Humisphaera borealis]|uniref:MOSC domain-containing protein n=1 Tax=Humisphaera borealis TaxID=2807512 RepID=A0A7M2WQW5_9BACT|nr:hypothetical protein [Humisphaera borealis]QOV87634.1 hypothetical protein IPV69_15205 [Humisphaera borealis]